MIESNFRSEESLSDYLNRHNVLGIANIDTRKLTRILRTKGSQSGCIMAGENLNEAEALEKAKSFAGLKGMDLAKEVTTSHPYEWKTDGVDARFQNRAVGGIQPIMDDRVGT